ncbi:MAG: PP2C family serine/threonine-protein phosphatase [Sedimenticolaceae bacterium]
MSEQNRPFEAAKVSLIGDRNCNQDRCLVLSSGDCVLLALADGLGGHPRGEVAAQLLVDVCETLFRHAAKPISDPMRFMLECIGKSHHAIMRFGRRQTPPIAPRTTAVLAVIQAGMAHWVHVGDSRLYLIRDGQVHIQTRDHAQVRFVRQSAKEASHPQASLTRCLGGLAQPPVTTCGLPTVLQQNDTVVLCSDGLWGQLPAHALTDAFAERAAPLAPGLQALADQAAGRPGSDNVTAVALRWLRQAVVQVDQTTLPEPQGDPQPDQAIRHLNHVLEKPSEPKR